MRGCRSIIQLSIFGLVLIEISQSSHYTDKWAVKIAGGERVARDLADKHDFVYLGKIMTDFYHFQHRKVAKRSVYPSPFHHRSLAAEPNVRWLQQQVAKKRVKRYDNYHYIPNTPNYNLNFRNPNDPKWNRMWYLNGWKANRGGGLDMNVMNAWKQDVTGKGVVVTILDDGIEKDHPDLQKNYDEKASYDVNGHDSDPQPRYDYTNENRHGTRCAGEVAAQRDNQICITGVAYDAKIGGVRMLDGDVTDSVEAQSLSLNIDHIDIYSASWGPDDDGRTVDGPATLARKAFYDGIQKGRNGLGSIFVWASGNGGRDGDSCNCDGYTNSIYTLSISSATENGNIPWYSEACSSTLATTYSSGSSGEKQIITTDLRKTCTETHTGTSASAPLAAGLCALALQVNPNLTWRDLQHIVVLTARRGNLGAPDWKLNGVNRSVSHSFGYGLMDAEAMVAHARNWSTVPEQHICEIRSSDHNKPVPSNVKITVQLHTDGCAGTANRVQYLEHVQARITLSATRRGEIQIFLTSPSRTRSTLLARRVRDTSPEGFNNWAFMTTHNWGETPQGIWTLEIENGASASWSTKLKDWVLVLYGTEKPPSSQKSPRSIPSDSTPSKKIISTPRPRPRHRHRPRPRPRPPTDRPFYPYIPRKPITKRPRIKYPPTYFPFTTKPPSPKCYFKGCHKVRSENHMCIFETLAKQRNMSTQQYMRMIRGNLTAAELKEWTLVVMGTSTHPQSRNITHQRKTEKEPIKCGGITSNGVCIECRQGFYKFEAGCVASCPELYYGTMETVLRDNNPNATIWSPQYEHRGVCQPCNDACRTCKGPYVEDCFQCNEGYETRDNYCRKKLIMNFLDPDMLSFFVWVIILCTSAILLFGIVFIVLQARDHNILCWRGEKERQSDQGSKGKYRDVPTRPVEERESDSDHFHTVLQNIHYNNTKYSLNRSYLPSRH